MHWKKKYNLAYIAHWRNKYNLAQILRIYCTLNALGKEAQSCTNLAHILRFGEIRTILRKSCAYTAHWGSKYTILRKSCTYLAHLLRTDTSNAQLAHLAQNTIMPNTSLNASEKDATDREIVESLKETFSVVKNKTQSMNKDLLNSYQLDVAASCSNLKTVSKHQAAKRLGIRPSMVKKTLNSFCQAPDPLSWFSSEQYRITGNSLSQLNIKKQSKSSGIAKADQQEINVISSGNA